MASTSFNTAVRSPDEATSNGNGRAGRHGSGHGGRVSWPRVGRKGDCARAGGAYLRRIALALNLEQHAGLRARDGGHEGPPPYATVGAAAPDLSHVGIFLPNEDELQHLKSDLRTKGEE